MNRRQFTEKIIISTGMISYLRPEMLKAMAKKNDKQWERGRPNILLLFSDQHKAEVMGYEKHPDVKTPNLDKLAGNGTVFSRAYCQDGICVPSRVSIMTGLYPRTLGLFENNDRPEILKKVLPLARILKNNGYYTAAYGKRHLPMKPFKCDDGWDEHSSHFFKESPKDNYVKWIKEQGLMEEFSQDWAAEFGHGPEGVEEVEKKYPRADLATRVSALPEDKTMEAYTAMKTIEFLKYQKNRNKPFFCWASFYRPHQPYNPLKKYFKMYDLKKGGMKMPGSLEESKNNLPPLMKNWRSNMNGVWCLGKAAKDHQIYQDYIGAYYALVTEIDHHVGRILQTLEEEGLSDNTIVIYAADHGDFVGAHGMVEKCAAGHNVYEDTLRVPLIFCWPKKFRNGAVCDDLVELVDVVPTLLDLIGIEYSHDEFKLAGKSLVPVLINGESVDRKYTVSENWSQMTVITKKYKLGMMIDPMIKPDWDYREFGDMLFDRQRDPLEINNVIKKSSYKKIEELLREYLDEWIKNTPDDGKKEMTSGYVEKLRALWEGEVVYKESDGRLILIGTWNDQHWIVPTPRAKAIWTSRINEAGSYNVELWYGDDPNQDHATEAKFTVIYQGGQKEFKINLRKNTEKWNRLGRFKFNKGWTGVVELDAGTANGNLITFKTRFKD